MSSWRHFPLKSSTHALLQYCESDHGKKQLALLASFFDFQVVSDHLAINAGSCSAEQLKDNLHPSTVNNGSGSTGNHRTNRDYGLDTSSSVKMGKEDPSHGDDGYQNLQDDNF
ncbi:hypothetical protein BGX21_004839, partial [Mortierella sp. AD011]